MPSLQSLKLCLSPIPAGKFGAADCSANSSTDTILEIYGDHRFIGLYNKKRGQFFDGRSRLLGRALPYPKPSIFRWSTGLGPDRASKEGLKDHKRGWIKLRNGKFQVVGSCGFSELDIDAPFAIDEPGCVDKPLLSSELFGKRKMRATTPSRLLTKEVSSAVSLPSLVVSAAHPMTKGRKPAIINVAKLLLSRHDLIMSWRNYGVN